MSYASKSSKTKPLVVGIAVLVVAAVAAKYYWPSATQEVKTPVQTVTTVKVVQRDFPLILDTTGTTVAVNVVDIRPQVTNVVTKVHIKEGQMVHAGDVLFSLDDRADRANFEKAKASADDAIRQYQRSQELLRQNFISQGAVDTAKANADAMQAAAYAAQAALSYDTIRSPITGRAGIINVFVGALVQPGNTVATTTTATATVTQGAMVTITQLDPINVQFTVPETALSTLFAEMKAGEFPKVMLNLADNQKRQGKVYVVDNQVDASIGAVKVKAQVDNADHSVIPGQFVRLQLNAGSIKDALVVQSQALVSNTRGDQIYVVGADDTVDLKSVQVKTQGQGFAVITGIEAGERVVVEGKQNLRPKSKVREAEAKTAKAGASAADAGASAAASSASGAASAETKTEAQK